MTGKPQNQFIFERKSFLLVKTALAACFFLYPFFCLAQNSVVFSRLSKADGLKADHVKCVWQDEEGFLWLGHENGLQRYDGSTFADIYTKDPAERLPPAAVDEIHNAGNHLVWVRQGSTIGLLNRKTYAYRRVDTESVPAGEKELRLFTGANGMTCLLTGTSDIYCYDNAKDGFFKAALPFKIPPHLPVNGITEDTSRHLYWLYGRQGLSSGYDAGEELTKRPATHAGQSALHDIIGTQAVSCLLVTRDSTYWIAYYKAQPAGRHISIMHYDPKKGQILLDSTFAPARDNREQLHISQIIEGTNGDIWMAGKHTLISFTNAGKSFYQHLQTAPGGYGLEGEEVYHLLEDREQNIWLGTDNGLFLTRPAKSGVFNFGIYNPLTGPVSVRSVLQTNTKEIWIAAWGRGIIFLDHLYQRVDVPAERRAELAARPINVLHQHSRTTYVWAGCENGELLVIDPVTKQVLQKIRPEIFAGAAINAICEDRSGDLWLSGSNGVLARWTLGSAYVSASFLSVHTFGSAIQQLLIDSKQQKWIATSANGLYVMDEKEEEIRRHLLPAGAVNVADIIAYNDSFSIAGTDRGIAIINNSTGAITSRTLYDGLRGASVKRMMADGTGAVWMITNNGLSCYHFEKDIFAYYDQHDGIVNADNATFSKALLAEHIWFGGQNVLFCFQPDTLKSEYIPPAVTITGFRLFNRALPLDSLLQLKQIVLDDREHSFSVSFSALTFSGQNRLTYFYMLEGVDKHWINGGGNASVSYSVLSPGAYIFKVRCENTEGISSAVTSIHLRINPPFYKSWWFILLLLAMGFLAMFGVYRQRLNRLLALEKLRSRVARDLHDDMGSTLSTINILSAMAKAKIRTEPEHVEAYLGKIGENSQQMMEVMDDIVWSIKPDNDNMQKITSRMRELATGLMEAKGIELEFVVDENTKNVRLDMEARRDLFLVFKEAVNNIVKYALCTKAYIGISCDHRRLVLSVRDNGVGFDQACADHGNGLMNMHKRAEAMEGILSVQSAPGSGTAVLLDIPLRNQHMNM